METNKLHDRIMYDEEELIKGMRWAISNNHYEALLNYYLENRQKLTSLDEFELYKIPCEADEDEIERLINANINFKFDLEAEIQSGSCYGLSCYIYQLITYIQTTHAQRV